MDKESIKQALLDMPDKEREALIYEVQQESNIQSKVIEARRNKTLITGLIVGLAIPFLYLLIFDFLNNKIETREDLERLTNVPVIGSITESKEDVNFVTMDKSRSSTAEAFRVLRTRITYLTKGQSQQTIMISSSITGEGKTFCAVNLAGIIALSGKKTLLLEMDLRKPRFYDYIIIDTTPVGGSN